MRHDIPMYRRKFFFFAEGSCNKERELCGFRVESTDDEREKKRGRLFPEKRTRPYRATSHNPRASFSQVESTALPYPIPSLGTMGREQCPQRVGCVGGGLESKGGQKAGGEANGACASGRDGFGHLTRP